MIQFEANKRLFFAYANKTLLRLTNLRITTTCRTRASIESFDRKSVMLCGYIWYSLILQGVVQFHVRDLWISTHHWWHRHVYTCIHKTYIHEYICVISSVSILPKGWEFDFFYCRSLRLFSRIFNGPKNLSSTDTLYLCLCVCSLGWYYHTLAHTHKILCSCLCMWILCVFMCILEI